MMKKEIEMRSYKVFTVEDGTEVYQDTIFSKDQGKSHHTKLKADGYKVMRVRDCLGGLQFETDLVLGRVTYSARRPVMA
jgi:hypothetical protein